MKRNRSLTFGVLLILFGGWFLAVQMIPSFGNWVDQFVDWPFWVIGPGLIFLVIAIVSGVSGLVIPGTILSGIGGILYYQDLTGDWESWSYAWTLIIGFVGIGVFLMHLLDGNLRKAVDEGGSAIMTSIVMFLIFGSVFRAFIFGQEPFLGDYWPVLLVAAGLWMLVRPLIRGGRKGVNVVVNIDSDDEEIEEVIEEL